eukprot:TRINITY_DN1161_c0_g2_i1.p1 TRINITY_DN1161_c0_g2~~TRINITY_DN1161_c0_g2_i1.p1  ORF type:complete len:681 (+),score=207.53 TRINITY_DN1161_c0_g2_i1:172-2214(+)
MEQRGQSPGEISPAIVGGLGDKAPEKRKRAADEVELLVRQYCAAKDWRSVHNLISALQIQFIRSVHPTLRKGGLLAISAVAIGADTAVREFVTDLAAPVMELFADPDNSGDRPVRYHAAESMYNIAKVARTHILVFFEQLFSGLCRLHADRDKQVPRAAHLLDTLVKDIASEGNLDITAFIRAYRERKNDGSPYVRSYLLTWLVVLDTDPHVQLVQYLPEFLEDVMRGMGDVNRSQIGTTAKVLDKLKYRLRQRCAEGRTIEWSPIITIVRDVLRDARDDRTRETALSWVLDILGLARRAVLPHAADLLSAVLPCIAENQSPNAAAARANHGLAGLVMAAQEGDEDERDELAALLPGLLEGLTRALADSDEPTTRCHALKWLWMLFEHNPGMVEVHFQRLFPELLKLLSDPSNSVVRLDLQVLAQITQEPRSSFELFLTQLVQLLQKDSYRLLPRAGMIVRTLATTQLDADDLFRTLSSILAKHTDLAFVSSLVTTLSMILLEAPELLQLRNLLKQGLEEARSRDLFTSLYQTWSFCPVAVVSLCLLARAYEHAYALIKILGEREVTVSMMLEMDKLVQLLELPVFCYVRIGLLEPRENPFLVKTLFGVLMLLPQSSAFEDLYKRLSCVNPLCNLPRTSDPLRDAVARIPGVDWQLLLREYYAVEEQKDEQFRKQMHESR